MRRYFTYLTYTTATRVNMHSLLTRLDGWVAGVLISFGLAFRAHCLKLDQGSG